MTTKLYPAVHEPSALPPQMISSATARCGLACISSFFHTSLVSFLLPLGLLARLRTGLTLPVAVQMHLDWVLDAFVVVFVLGKCNGFYMLIYVMETAIIVMKKLTLNGAQHL